MTGLETNTTGSLSGSNDEGESTRAFDMPVSPCKEPASLKTRCMSVVTEESTRARCELTDSETSLLRVPSYPGHLSSTYFMILPAQPSAEELEPAGRLRRVEAMVWLGGSDSPRK